MTFNLIQLSFLINTYFVNEINHEADMRSDHTGTSVHIESKVKCVRLSFYLSKTLSVNLDPD